MYNHVKELAEKLLDIALKYDELDKFITSYPGYELYVNDGMGNKVNSVDAMMIAIYKKYSTDNRISNKLYEAIYKRGISNYDGDFIEDFKNYDRELEADYGCKIL